MDSAVQMHLEPAVLPPKTPEMSAAPMHAMLSLECATRRKLKLTFGDVFVARADQSEEFLMN